MDKWGVRQWVIPLIASTFFLAFGIRWAENHLDKPTRLIVSLAFAGLWEFAGIYIGFIQPRRNPLLPERVREAMRVLGLVFLGFGGVWAILSIVQYVR